MDEDVIISFKINSRTDNILFNSVDNKMEEYGKHILQGVYRCDGKKLKVYKIKIEDFYNKD